MARKKQHFLRPPRTVIHLDISVDGSDIKRGAYHVLEVIRPHWKHEHIQFKYFDGGISNQMIGCYVGENLAEDVVLVRLYGAGTKFFVNREAELRYICYLSQEGMCPPLYATFNNGRAYGYCQGVPLDHKTFKTYRRQIIKEMVKLHSLKPDFMDDPPVSEFIGKVEKWLQMIPKVYTDLGNQERFVKEVPPLSELKAEYKILKRMIDSMDTRIVLCHNDLLWTNIIYNELSDKVTFIDHEFTMFNYQAFDIGDHFTEYVGTEDMDPDRYPDREYQMEWLRLYLEEWNKHNQIDTIVTEDDVNELYIKANKFALVANFSWSIWAFKMAEHPDIDFDYLGYGIIRLKQYFAKKDEFLSL